MTSTGQEEDQERWKARIGTTLRGKWKLDALLGVGGMAAVYSATHRIGKRGAIKILHPEVAVSKELRARFEQEAHAVAKLSHPNAIEVLDVDTTEEGAPFMVMELLDGESLGQRAFRLSGIPEMELLGYMHTALDVLAAAHGQGIIHRDIKPDNLFVTGDGRLKVLDFGIARMSGGDVHTRAGMMLGTTSYMAPEQIHGKPIDGRADVYAVGATMFRILAKRRIHEAGSDAELLVKMGTQQAPPIASVAHVDPRTAIVIDRALAFQVEQRYPNAAAMRDDVRAILDGREPGYAGAVATRMDAPTAADTGGGGAAMAAAGAMLGAGAALSQMATDPTQAPLSVGPRSVGVPASAPAFVSDPTRAATPAALHPSDAAPASTTSGPAMYVGGYSPGAKTQNDSKTPIGVVLAIGGATLLLGVGITAWVMLGDASSKSSAAESGESDESASDDGRPARGSTNGANVAASSAAVSGTEEPAGAAAGASKPVTIRPGLAVTPGVIATSTTATAKPTSTAKPAAPTSKGGDDDDDDDDDKGKGKSNGKTGGKGKSGEKKPH